MESSKRRRPTVSPVVFKGLRFEALRRPRDHGSAQSGGALAAFDEKSNKYLWGVQLYTTVFDEREERDVQEVYIKELSVSAGVDAVLATDELDRRWSVDIVTHEVTPAR
ncbi:MAG TPA: hypothetical protein VF453_09795 [Burkholderiaceae bacterium]